MVATLSTYQERFFITSEDYENFKTAGEYLKQEVISIYSKCFEWINDHAPEMMDYIPSIFMEDLKDEHSEARAKWYALCNAEITEDYVRRQAELTRYFANGGISYDTYLSYQVYFVEVMENTLEEKAALSKQIHRSFRKLMHIAEAVIVDVYTEMKNKTLIEQNNALKEMSTPVTELWDGILLLPLVGFVDSKRAQDVLTTMLNEIASTQSRFFILDISGIGMVDTAVANHLIKMTKATRLMGCRCIISGIGGAVAQTIVELGISIDEIETTGTMQDALRMAMEELG